jgi:hypothetical protein
MTEAQLWELQKKYATAALEYWIDFMDFRDANGKPLSANCKKRLLCIIRLVSWVESHHGTLGKNQPARDPMQSGNPNDIWWQELTGQKGQKVDRFVRGPAKQGNYWAPELPGAVELVLDPTITLPPIPWTNEQIEWVRQQIKGHTPLPLPNRGHKNKEFTPWMSYFWGVIYLLHKLFKGYKLSDCSCKSLIRKAVGYNGVGRNAGDPKYEEHLNQAAKDIECCEDD